MKVIVSLLILSVFSVTAAIGAEPKNQRLLSACGPSTVKFNAHKGTQQQGTAPNDHSASVYIISELQYGGIPVGCQVVTRIGVDGKWVGANCGSSYLSTTVSAGEHHVCADWQSSVFLSPRPHPALDNFVAEAGKTYYFRAKAVYVEGSTTIDLSKINADEGRLLVATQHASTSKPKK